MRAYSYRCGKFIETTKACKPAGTSSTLSEREQLLNMNYIVYLFIYVLLLLLLLWNSNSETPHRQDKLQLFA